MERSTYLLFALFALIFAFEIRSASVTCAYPVAGWGLYSLKFDPVTQVATSVTFSSSYYDTWSNFTIQAWIYLTPISLPAVDERPVLFKGPFSQGGGNGARSSAEFYLYVNGSNYVSFLMGGGGPEFGFNLAAGPVNADQWTHVSVTVNSVTRTASLFIDGSLILSQTWLLASPSAPYTDGQATPRVPSGRIQMALYSPIFSTGTQRFNGRIDEVRVWNRSLAANEIFATLNKALVGDEDGLISYFPFDEGSGGSVSSPWPSSGIGRRAPSWVTTSTGAINPAATLVWGSSEVQVNHPTTYYGIPGQSVVVPGRQVSFYLYAIVPSGATAASNLAYVINDFPQGGSIYWDGVLIDINYGGPDIAGNRTNPYPVLTYVPNDSFQSADSLTYYAYYRDGVSELITVPFSLGCRFIDACNVCEGNNSCINDCLANQKDVCGVCFGNGSTCLGCGGGKLYDSCGVCGGNNEEMDVCGVCFGNGSSCAGCDGVPNSGVVTDACGVCGGMNRSMDVCGVCKGNGSSCVGCDGIPQADPAKRRVIDACGVCTLPDNANATCRGCDGLVRFPPKLLDQCGVCGGNDSTCRSGCDNMPNSNKIFDACGVCGGDGSSCAGCDGIPHKDPSLRKTLDVCGVCGGNGSSCADCDGVPYGPNPPDVCGVCGGNGTSCLDCSGCPFGDKVEDVCGVCGGDNSSCTGCDGIPVKDPLLRVVMDICGVCGGNGTSCADQWCDPTIPLSQLDACGVCNGDNSSCTCVTYRNRSMAELDCALLGWALSNTVQAIDKQLGLLNQTKMALGQVELGALNEWIGGQIRQINSFISDCTEPFCTTLSSVVDELGPSFSPQARSFKSLFTSTLFGPSYASSPRSYFFPTTR